ncbi:hypothetical protein CRG98_048066, partial [Punica granatum]
RWNCERIASWLNNSSLLRIASVVASASSVHRDDVPFWRLAPSRNYTVASAYKLLTVGSGTDHYSKLWKNIWRWEGPQRIRFFLWRFAGESLLTNEARYRKSLCDTPSCPHCESGAESTLHVSRDCVLAKQIWSRLVPIDAQPEFFTLDLLDWLWQNLSYPYYQHWSTTFATSCWLLWSWRNNELFESDFNCPTLACRTILQTARSFREGWALVEKVIGTTSKRWVNISWIRPPEDFFKLNTDGSSRGNPGAAEASGLLRDADGRWIVGFSQNIGIAIVTMAELWGVLTGTEMAWKTLRGRILDLCSRDWEVRMQHTYREGNSCADKLANMAVEYPLGTNIIHSVPNGVFQLLLGDIVGATMPRLIPVSL